MVRSTLTTDPGVWRVGDGQAGASDCRSEWQARVCRSARCSVDSSRSTTSACVRPRASFQCGEVEEPHRAYLRRRARDRGRLDVLVQGVPGEVQRPLDELCPRHLRAARRVDDGADEAGAGDRMVAHHPQVVHRDRDLPHRRGHGEPRALHPAVADHLGRLREDFPDGVQLGEAGGQDVAAVQAPPLGPWIGPGLAHRRTRPGHETAHEDLPFVAKSNDSTVRRRRPRGNRNLGSRPQAVGSNSVSPRRFRCIG